MKRSRSRGATKASAVEQPPSCAGGGAGSNAEPRTVRCQLDQEVIDRLDALAKRLSSRWLKVKRSNALRKVILSGLERIEREGRGSEGRINPDRPRRARKTKPR